MSLHWYWAICRAGADSTPGSSRFKEKNQGDNSASCLRGKGRVPIRPQNQASELSSESSPLNMLMCAGNVTNCLEIVSYSQFSHREIQAVVRATDA